MSTAISTSTKLSTLILSTAFIFSSGNLIAEENADEKKSARDDQVLVITSTHREENIQHVPLTVTALGAETLKKSDINGVEGIVRCNNSRQV